MDIWRDETIIKFEPVLIKKKAWLEIGFLNFKFLSTAGIETYLLFKIKIVLKEKCKKTIQK